MNMGTYNLNSFHAQPSHRQDAGGHNPLDIREVFLFLKRNYRTVLAVSALVLAVCLAYTVIKTPLYTATTTVVMNANEAKVVNFESVLTSMMASDEAIISELEIIKSRPMAEKVIKKLNLQDDTEFNPKRSPDDATSEIEAQARVIDRFLSRLTAMRKPKSYIIEIAYTNRSPQKAKLIADTVAEVYIISQLENKFAANQEANDWLSKKITDLQETLSESEKKVQEFRAQNNLLETTNGVTIGEQQLSELNSQLVLARAGRAEAESKLANSRMSIESTSEVLNSNLIQALRTQEAEVLRKKADLSNRYGPKHPKMINVNAELSDLNTKITSEIGKIRGSLETEVDNAISREQALEENLQSLQGQTGDNSGASVKLSQLVREMNANRTLYEGFLTRYKQTSEGNGSEKADARIVSKAMTPVSPSHPRKLLIILVGIIIGPMLGVLLAIGLEALDHTFKNKRILENATHLPVVGMLPEITNRNRDPENQSIYHEALKGTFVSLNLVKQGGESKVIMITSSIPEEGKTFFSYSFAAMLAKSGKKVVLIDADFKRSTLTRKIYDRDFLFCLNSVVDPGATPEKMIVNNIIPNLSFIPCKMQETETADIIASKAMEELVLKLRGMYDYVVFDTPPIMAVSDAMVAARMVDITMFIVRWGKTPCQIVTAAVSRLKPTKAPIALVVTRANLDKLHAYDVAEAAYYYKEYKNQ